MALEGTLIWRRVIVPLDLKQSDRIRISARVRESTLTKTPANESMRVQLESRKLSDVSHKLNTGESKDS